MHENEVLTFPVIACGLGVAFLAAAATCEAAGSLTAQAPLPLCANTSVLHRRPERHRHNRLVTLGQGEINMLPG